MKNRVNHANSERISSNCEQHRQQQKHQRGRRRMQHHQLQGKPILKKESSIFFKEFCFLEKGFSWDTHLEIDINLIMNFWRLHSTETIKYLHELHTNYTITILNSWYAQVISLFSEAPDTYIQALFYTFA